MQCNISNPQDMVRVMAASRPAELQIRPVLPSLLPSPGGGLVPPEPIWLSALASLMLRLRNLVKRTGCGVMAVALKGDNFACPLCDGRYRRLLPFGARLRANAMCPGCQSLERDRLLWLIWQQLWSQDRLPRSGRMLHVAPESALVPHFAAHYDYLSIDLNGAKAMRAMDVTDLDFPAACFDIVVCNHVLEHIADDRRAMAEIYRVLKPGGWGSLQVPIKGDVTREDLTVTEPRERLKLYGNKDHVRQYGWDFTNRLKDAGFETARLQASELLEAGQIARAAATGQRPMILARKPG